MARIDEVIRRYSDAVGRGERQATEPLLRAYQAAWQRLERDAERLAKRIEGLRRDGRAPSLGQLYRVERYADLERQLLTEMERISGQATALIGRGQTLMTELGQRFSIEAASALSPDAAGVRAAWHRLGAAELQHLVGALDPSSPLGELLDALPTATSERLQRALVEAVSLGYNPRDVVRAIRGVVDLAVQRALTISRTEQLRAYRGSALEAYRANADVVTGWRRLAAHSPRTCIACIALDGTVYRLESEPDFHPNDRCALVPVLHRELPLGQSATEWFGEQNKATQRAMMGPLAHRAWTAGEIELRNLVRHTESTAWGRTATVGSVRAALRRDAA